MNARESFRMCELLRDYMGGPLQSKALKHLPSVRIVAGRKSDSQLPAGCPTLIFSCHKPLVSAGCCPFSSRGVGIVDLSLLDNVFSKLVDFLLIQVNPSDFQDGGTEFLNPPFRAAIATFFGLLKGRILNLGNQRFEAFNVRKLVELFQ